MLNNNELLTEDQATLVMTILLDSLLELKAAEGLYDDFGTIKDLETAIKKLDSTFIKLGYSDENE